ncbi:MAG: hypothetical protein QG673_1761 [Pseudomonadota bacterium]|nr:hypothetical protein [Pseudomonadota bacterium]
MTTGALIAIEIFIFLVVVFGVYAGYHREEDVHKRSKHKHA